MFVIPTPVSRYSFIHVRGSGVTPGQRVGGRSGLGVDLICQSKQTFKKQKTNAVGERLRYVGKAQQALLHWAR